jgi:hypothetical protein
VPVNAAQFGTAVNAVALAASKPTLGVFLLANSTNSAVAPDFKTIAASFLTNVATNISVKPTTATQFSAVPTRSVTAAGRERETKKDRSTLDLESSLPFSPVIPAHLLNIPVSFFQVPSHPQLGRPAKQEDVPLKADSIVLTDNPLEIPNQVDTKKVGAQLFEQSPLPPTNYSNTSFDLNSGTPVSTSSLPPKDSPVQEPSDLFADSGKSTDSNENVSALSAQFAQAPTEAASDPLRSRSNATTEVESKAASSVTSMSSTKQPKINSCADKSVADRLAEKITSKPQSEFAEVKLDAPAVNTNQVSASRDIPQLHSAMRIPRSTQNQASEQDVRPDNANQPIATVDGNQSPQNFPTLPIAVESVLQTVLAEPKAVGNKVTPTSTTPIFETHSTATYSIPPSTIALTQAAQLEAAPMQPVAISTLVPPNEASKQSVAANSLLAAPITAKSAAAKNRTETTTKIKTNQSETDKDPDATTTTEVRQHDVHPVSALQTAANTVTDKNHDAATQLISVTPHTKVVTAKDVPQATSTALANGQTPDIDDTAPPPTHTSINTAKLVQGLSQSELRVGLQTRDFGNIDIRTSVNRHEFSAQISVEHNDVARTLITELPSLYARLNDHQVTVSNIQIQNQGLSTSTGLDQQSQQPSSRQQNEGDTMKSHAETTISLIREVFASTERLDIRI